MESSLWAKNRSGVQEKKERRLGGWCSHLPTACKDGTTLPKVWQAKRGSQQPEVSYRIGLSAPPSGVPCRCIALEENRNPALCGWALSKCRWWTPRLAPRASPSPEQPAAAVATLPKINNNSLKNKTKQKSCLFSIVRFLLELMTVVKKKKQQTSPQSLPPHCEFGMVVGRVGGRTSGSTLCAWVW